MGVGQLGWAQMGWARSLREANAGREPRRSASGGRAIPRSHVRLLFRALQASRASAGERLRMPATNKHRKTNATPTWICLLAQTSAVDVTVEPLGCIRTGRGHEWIRHVANQDLARLRDNILHLSCPVSLLLASGSEPSDARVGPPTVPGASRQGGQCRPGP